MAEKIEYTQKELKTLLERNIFYVVKDTINTNQSIRVRDLKQEKLKMLNEPRLKPNGLP